MKRMSFQTFLAFTVAFPFLSTVPTVHAKTDDNAPSFEIGAALEDEAFWKSDPVLFVSRHAKNGFEFTSEDRSRADSRLDGGVVFHGVSVYESRLSFGAEGGIERIELLLYNRGGTETYQTIRSENGKTFRQRVRVKKALSEEEFMTILDLVRRSLTAEGIKPPAIQKERPKADGPINYSQTWPKTEIPTQATLSWCTEWIKSKKAFVDDLFLPGFIRVTVKGPVLLAGGSRRDKASKGFSKTKGVKKITDNVVKDPRGDVFIDNIPMVDQGQKGYCSAASAERVLRYFGLEVDEHDVALAAGTSAESGTSTRAMKDAVAAIGKRFKLGTVVCYGNFDKSADERIASIVDEVRSYNKAAKKLKKSTIEDNVYISRSGNIITYSPSAVDAVMDAEVLKEMKVNGMHRAKYTKFLADIRQQIDKGIPLFWGVKLGTYPEPGLMQMGGYHTRLIIGYNDKKKEILYTDSWGAGHELKRMPADWAWTISHYVMYMKPLTK